MSQKTRTQRLLHSIREAPENIRLATISAWRGKERGLAVVAGVFLASLVITTVLSYGVGLSQVFFSESLENEPFDAKIEFKFKPVEGVEGWTNDSAILQSACVELLDKYSELADCTLTFGKQGVHGDSFFNVDFMDAQNLDVVSIVDDENLNWDNVSFNYDEVKSAGPPSYAQRGIRFFGEGAFDGVIAERISPQIIAGMGEWPNAETMEGQRGVILPADVASQAQAVVGQTLENLSFWYTLEDVSDGCDGEITSLEGLEHCRIEMSIENVTILGIYEPFPIGNPMLTINPIFASATILDSNQTNTLLTNDHGYLGIAVDRAQLPTSSTAAASEWLDDLAKRIGDDSFTDANIEFYYGDITSGTITFLNIFLGLIQIFDYIIMIPIVILSLSVLIYGLILSLEQRRREIAIHRVIGGDVKGLQGMVLLELAVMASVAWFAGYLLAMAAVPVVLSAVGFMEFRASDFDVDPTLSFVSTLITMAATLGLALLFGRSRSRKFIEMEIEEGVRNVAQASEPKTWLHWLMFLIGAFGAIDTYMEMNGSEDGLVSNFFIEGLLGIFGPFMLWIGGALLLGRLGAMGPMMMQFLLGRTPLLKDVKRGLKGSGSAESVNRLAVIMLLTLSIVTLAAVQGYTGTMVDEKTANMNSGSDLKITFEDSIDSTTAMAIVEDVHGSSIGLEATTVPELVLKSKTEGATLQTYVLLNGNEDVLFWDEQGIPGDDIDEAMQAYSGLTFTAGEEAAYNLDLAGSGRGADQLEDVILGEDDVRSEDHLLVWEETKIEFVDVENVSIDYMQVLGEYQSQMVRDWSGLDLSGQDLTGRNLTRSDFSNANLSGADLSGADLSESLFFNTDLTGTNFSGAKMPNVVLVVMENQFGGNDFSNAMMFGAYDISEQLSFNSSLSLDGAICPDGSPASQTMCASGFSATPPPAVAPLLSTPSSIQITVIEHNVTLRYIGNHEYIPGVSTASIANGLIIGEESWRAFVGDDAADNYTSAVWIIDTDELAGEELEALRISLEADSRVGEATDWSTEHKKVERNGGLIFGTPGLLSLQFVVASIAAVASSFVFLSLVLNQRQKELAILQAIGASPNQIIRLVLFEILSIVMVSMALGVGLGIAVALSFNGFFEIFGFIFQIFGGSSTVVTRDLVYPWFELGIVSVSVFAAVVLALLWTTTRALRSDLASVLKGE